MDITFLENLLIAIFKVLISSALFLAGAWHAYGFRAIMDYEKRIIKKQTEVDNLENDTESKRLLSSGNVNQKQFEAITEKRKKPLLAELNMLKMKRQFWLDKLPLISLLKH